MVLRPSHIRWIAFGLAILFSLPILGAPFLGFYLWMSPYIMINALLAGKGLAWLHLLGTGVLGAIIIKQRWICKYACPAGVVCDLSSGWGRKKGPKVKFPVNKFLALFAFGTALLGFPVLMVLDPFNLFFMAFEGIRTGPGTAALFKLSGLVFLILFSLVFPHLWCGSVCPLGGVQLLVTDLKKLFATPASRKGVRPDRRMFLAGFSGIIGGLILSRVWPRGDNPPIRPPFALKEVELNAACIRCGSCSAACPTHIISPSPDVHCPQRLLTPVVKFRESYCLPGCNDCGTVCPSGAIRSFRAADKKEHIMGLAVIEEESCYLRTGRECNQCRHYCEYEAIEMKSGPAISRIPVILIDKCVGCGACQVVCPPQAIKIVLS